jgi:dTMP kinase
MVTNHKGNFPEVPVFVAYEGIDGAGKTTQTDLLRRTLGARLIKFPVYSSPTGEIIQAMLRGEATLYAPHMPTDKLAHKDAITLQALMVTNRLEVATDILGTLSRGSLVCDRYSASAMAYGVADGLDSGWLRRIHELLPMPDLYVLLDLPASESFERRPERQDAYEANFTRIEFAAQNYRNLWTHAESYGAPLSWRKGHSRYLMLDARLPVQDLHERVVAEVRKVQNEVLMRA